MYPPYLHTPEPLVWTIWPQLVMLLGKAVKPWGGKTLRKWIARGELWNFTAQPHSLFSLCFLAKDEMWPATSSSCAHLTTRDWTLSQDKVSPHPPVAFVKYLATAMKVVSTPGSKFMTRYFHGVDSKSSKTVRSSEIQDYQHWLI